MKLDRIFGKLLLIATVCVFCACSSDDDENDGTGGTSDSSSITVNINGEKTVLNTAYWWAEESSDNKTFYQLIFMSFDLYKYMENPDISKYPSSYSVFSISYEAPGSTSELATGSFSSDNYELSGMLGSTLDKPDGKYYVEQGPESGNLSVTKNGNSYTITISSLEAIYSDPADSGQSELGSTKISWNYTGEINKAPYGY